MESTRESMTVATKELANLVGKPLERKPSRLSKIVHKLDRYSHARPYPVGFLISVGCVSLLYGFWVSWVTREPLVPSAGMMVVMVGVMGGLGVLIGNALKS
jgi:hypothetical protein